MEDGVVLRLETFTVVKETPCGKWVKSQYAPTWLEFDELKKRKFLKWISNSSTKKLCYDKLEGAINSFYHRKRMQVSRLKYQLEQAQLALESIETIKTKGVEDFQGGLNIGEIPSQGELCWDY